MLALLKVAALAAFTASVALFDSASRTDALRADNFQTLQSARQRPTSHSQRTRRQTPCRIHCANQWRRPREKTKLDPVPALPDIKLDKDTSMGFGHGGIIGLERKFLTASIPPYGRHVFSSGMSGLVTRDLAQHIFHQRIRIATPPHCAA